MDSGLLDRASAEDAASRPGCNPKRRNGCVLMVCLCQIPNIDMGKMGSAFRSLNTGEI